MDLEYKLLIAIGIIGVVFLIIFYVIPKISFGGLFGLFKKIPSIVWMMVIGFGLWKIFFRGND